MFFVFFFFVFSVYWIFRALHARWSLKGMEALVMLARQQQLQLCNWTSQIFLFYLLMELCYGTVFVFYLLTIV